MMRTTGLKRIMGSKWTLQFLCFCVILLAANPSSLSVSADCLAVVDRAFRHDCGKSAGCQGNWTGLTLTGDTYDDLPSGFFTLCAYVSDLVILNAKAKVLDGQRFRGLSSLKSLTINDLPLYKLTDNLLEGVPELMELTVSQGKGLQLLPETFKPCAKLQKLVFDKTHVVGIQPHAFSSCELTLKKMYIRSGRLEGIPLRAFSRLTGLTLLDLSVNSLVELGPRIFADLSDLRSLVLKRNYIRSIDDFAFQGLTALVKLDLSSNRLTAFSALALIQMPHLKRLKLDNNRLLQLDSMILRSSAGLQISLKNNRLKCHPLIGSDSPQIVGLPEDLPLCAKLVPTTTKPRRKMSEESPKHQMYSDKKSEEGSGNSWLTSNRQMILMTPSWLLAWAICMTIGFVIVLCLLAFMFWNRRRAAVERNREEINQDHDQPLNGEATL